MAGIRIHINASFNIHKWTTATLRDWINKGMVFYVTFNSFFNHTMTVFACDRYDGCYHIALPHRVPCCKRPEHRYPTQSHYPNRHQANRSKLYPLNAGRQARKHLVPFFYVFGLTRPGTDPTTSRLRGGPSYHLATTAREMLNLKQGNC